MNEEQKYQQYLANGGEASFEEYQSVAAMFSPAEMDELAGLKKKDGTQPTEKNSLTAGSATTTSESTPGEPLIPNPIPQSEFMVPMGSEQDLISVSSDTTAQTPSTDLPSTDVVSSGTESSQTNQPLSGIATPTLDNAGNIPMPVTPKDFNFFKTKITEVGKELKNIQANPLFGQNKKLTEEISLLDKEYAKFENDTEFKSAFQKINEVTEKINQISSKAVDGKLPTAEYNEYKKLEDDLNAIKNNPSFAEKKAKQDEILTKRGNLFREYEKLSNSDEFKTLYERQNSLVTEYNSLQNSTDYKTSIDLENKRLKDEFQEANKTKFAQNGKRATLTFEGTNEDPIDVLGGKNNEIQGEITMTPSSPEALAADAEKRDQEAQAQIKSQEQQSSDFINQYVNKDYIRTKLDEFNPAKPKWIDKVATDINPEAYVNQILEQEKRGEVKVARNADGQLIDKNSEPITDNSNILWQPQGEYINTYNASVRNFNYQVGEQNIDKARFNQGNIGNNPEQDSFGEFMSQASKFGVIPTTEEYEALTTETARNEYLASLEATQNAQKNKTTFQEEYDKIIGKYNLTDEVKFANGFDAVNLLNQGIENGNDKDKAEIDYFTKFFGDRNNVMDFGEYWEREGKAKYKSSLVRENQANYQQTRADIWNDYLSYKNDKLGVNQRFLEEAVVTSSAKADNYALEGNTAALEQERAKMENLYSQYEANEAKMYEISEIFRESNKSFTSVAEKRKEQEDFQTKVEKGDFFDNAKNIAGQIPLAIGTSVNNLIGGGVRIANTILRSENLKDAADIIGETEIKVGNVKLDSRINQRIKYFKDQTTGVNYEERNGVLYGRNAKGELYKPSVQPDINNLKLEREETKLNGSGAVFGLTKLLSDIALTRGVGKSLNYSSKLLNNSKNIASVFGVESQFAKIASSYAKVANSQKAETIAYWFTQTFNENYLAAEAAGITSEKGKEIYATMMSGMIAGTSVISPDQNFLKVMNTNSRNIVASLLEGNIQKGALQASNLLKKLGVDVTNELKEEVPQQLLQDVGNIITNEIADTTFQTSTKEDYKDVVDGTIITVGAISLFGSGASLKNSNRATINNEVIDLSIMPRSEVITKLAMDSRGLDYIRDYKESAIYPSLKNAAQKIEDEIATRKKYIDKIPDVEKYPTSALSEVTPILQELERKREQLKNDDGTFAKILNTEIETLTTQVNSILSGETVSENQQQNNTTENAETPQPTPQSETVQEQATTTDNESEQTAVQQTPPIAPVEPNGNAGAESGVTLNTEPNGQATTEIQSPASQAEENVQPSVEERRDAADQLPEMGESNQEPEQITQETAPEEEVSDEEQKRLNIEALQRILQQQNSTEKVSATPDVISADANKETIQTSNPNLSVRKTTDATTGNSVYEFIDRKTGKVKKVDEKTERKHLTDLVKNTAYPETAVPEGVQNPNDLNQVILQDSKNPVEIANILMTIPKYQFDKGSKEYHIANNITRVSHQSFINHSDKNNITMGLAQAYFAKKGTETNEMNIDRIAFNASSDFAGGEYGNDEITVGDVVKFILEYRAGVDSFFKQPNPDYQSAVNRFVALTGMNPSQKVLKDILGLNTENIEVEERAKVYAENQVDKLSTEQQNNLANQYDQWFNSLTLQEQTAELQNTYPYEDITGREQAEVEKQSKPADSKRQGSTDAPNESTAKQSEKTSRKTNASPEYQQLLKDRTAQEARVKSAKEKFDRVSRATNQNFQADQENLFGERQNDGGMFDERADGNAGRNIIAEAKAEYDRERAELTRINNAIRDFESGNASGTGVIDFVEDENSKYETTEFTQNTTEEGETFLSTPGADYGRGDNPVRNESNPTQGEYDRITVRGVWKEVGDLVFSGRTKVRSPHDVAFIMRLLENKAVEHAFAVHQLEDGTVFIQFLGIGGRTMQVIDLAMVAAGVQRYGSRRVTLIHNHPSGSLKPSNADLTMTDRARTLMTNMGVELDHIVINTYHKQFIYIGEDNTWSNEPMIESIGEQHQIKTEALTDQELIEKPIGQITSSRDAVTAIQQFRFTVFPKSGILILNQRNEIIGNYVLQGDLSADEIVRKATETGIATSVIIYGNQVGKSQEVKGVLEKANINVLDVIVTESDTDAVKEAYTSWADEGILREHQEAYKTSNHVAEGENNTSYGELGDSEKSNNFDRNNIDNDQRTAIYDQLESVLGRSGTQEAEVGKEKTNDRRASEISPQALRQTLVVNAKKTGNYISDISSLSAKQLPSGHESEVHLSKDRTKVLKANRLPFLNDNFSFNDWVEKIIGHNQTFPDVAYTIKGVTRNSNGEISIVLEQPAIDVDTNQPATQQEIDQKLTELGFTKKKDGSSIYWTNGVYNVSDAEPKNVLKDADGDLYFVDAYVVRTPNPNIDTQTNPDVSGTGAIDFQSTDKTFTPIPQKTYDKLVKRLLGVFKKFGGKVITDLDKFKAKAKALGIPDSSIDKMEVSIQEFRDGHTAPSMGDLTIEDALENSSGFNLAEVARGQHNQPSDYFDEKVGARYYGYDDTAGMQSATAIRNIIRALKSGKNSKDLTITIYRSIPNNINENELIQYDWVSPSKKYAENHGESRFGEGEYKIIEQEVPIAHVWWDGNDIREWGYDPSNDVRFMKTANGEIYGAKLPDGTIYLNPEKVNANTPIHEFSHLWQQLMPTRFKKGVELLKNTPIGKRTFADLKANEGYANKSDAELWNEALVTVMGNEGERIFNSPRTSKFKEWLVDLFKKLGNAFGIRNLSPTDKLSTFVKGALGEVMGNSKLVPETTLQNGNIDFQIPNKTLTEIVKAIDSNGNDSGFEKLQNSDWYQNLSDTEQDEFNSGNYVQKLLAVSTDQGKSAEKENTSLKDKIEKIKEKYSQKIAEVKANSAKTSRERIAKIRNIQKQAYEDVVDLVTKDKIRRKMTPAETSRLIKAAAAILNTNQTEKALDRFVDLYNKTNSYEYEKQAANDKKRLDKISDAVNNAFSNGETLQDVYDSNPNLFKFDGPKEIARRVFERLESEKNPDPKVLEKSLERSRQVNDAINRRPGFMEVQKAVRRRIIKEATDRQFLPKHILKNIGAKQTYNRMVAVGGASASAKNMYQKTHDKIFAKLTNEDKAHLNEMIKLKRVIAIDENREQRGMEPIDHEGGMNKFSAKKALDQMKEKIGAEKFNQLDKNSTVYFDAFKDILKQMKEAGMINDAQYESMADVDYQPRQVLSHLFDMEFDKDGKLIKMTPITGENISDSFPGLSKDQIRSFQEGSLGLIMNDAESLLSNAILGRTKAIFMNRVNKTFINRDFPAAKLEYETLKSKAEKDLTSENKRFIKYFEELGTMVKENPMVDISPSGKPIFMFKDLPSANWKRAYYFENGIRKEFFMRNDLYEDWHDTMKKLDGAAKDVISTISGSSITKLMATGRNPGFALVNTPRDFGSLILLSEEYNNFSPIATVQVAKDAIKGIREIYRYNNTQKDNILEKYLKYGGGMDFLNTEGETPTLLKYYEKVFGKNTVNNKTKTLFGGIFDMATLKSVSNYSEMMFRVGTFDRAVNNRLQKLGVKNISDLDARTQEDIYIEAVERSRKILDFNQGGRTAKSLEAVIPYLNAATQGGRVLADSMTNRPYATTARLLQGAGLLASAGIGMTMLALSAFDDDDEDKRTAIEKYLDIKEGLSRFQKRGYVHFFTGKKNENGEYTSYKMAIPQALTPLYTFVDNILDDVLRNIAGRKTNGLGLAIDEAQEAFSANVDPIGITDFTKLGTKNPIIKSMVTYASGYDFFRDQNLDGSINKVPRRVEGFENKKVEDFYKKFGLETGFSPVRTKAAVESILTSPDTNPFLSMIYGGVDAAVGYDSGFTEKKGFAKTFIGSFEKRISAETSDYSRFNNSLSEDARKRVEDKAVDDYLIDTIVTSAVKSNKDNNGDWLNGVVQNVMNNKSITRQKQAYLIEKLATKYTDLKTKGGGDPAIGYIKYETFGKSQAKAQAIIEIYGKDFPRNKEVMQKLMLNQLLTDDVIINLDAYGIKFNNLREQIQDLQEELR